MVESADVSAAAQPLQKTSKNKAVVVGGGKVKSDVIEALDETKNLNFLSCYEWTTQKQHTANHPKWSHFHRDAWWWQLVLIA